MSRQQQLCRRSGCRSSTHGSPDKPWSACTQAQHERRLPMDTLNIHPQDATGWHRKHSYPGLPCQQHDQQTPRQPECYIRKHGGWTTLYQHDSFQISQPKNAIEGDSTRRFHRHLPEASGCAHPYRRSQRHPVPHNAVSGKSRQYQIMSIVIKANTKQCCLIHAPLLQGSGAISHQCRLKSCDDVIQ